MRLLIGFLRLFILCINVDLLVQYFFFCVYGGRGGGSVLTPPPKKKSFTFTLGIIMRISLGSRFILFHIELIFLVIVFFFFFFLGGHILFGRLYSRHCQSVGMVSAPIISYIGENRAGWGGCSIYPFPHERNLKPLIVVSFWTQIITWSLHCPPMNYPLKCMVLSIPWCTCFIHTHCTNVHNLSFYNWGGRCNIVLTLALMKFELHASIQNFIPYSTTC